MTQLGVRPRCWLLVAAVFVATDLRVIAQDTAPGEETRSAPETAMPNDNSPNEGTPAGPGGTAGFEGRSTLDTPPELRGIYDKPFLTGLWRRSYFGGYYELEYHSEKDGIMNTPEGFRLHRTNLFFFTEVTDRVRFASELEFETEFEGAETSDDIETKIEMAFVDWTIFQEFVIRGGALLVPLGRINVNHDGPIRLFTERPMVSTFVIPTTFTEPGIGAQGTINPTDALELSYEAYAVNGFNVLDADGELAAPLVDSQDLLSEARTSLGGDNNGNTTGTGRLGLTLFDAVEVGGSWHVGTYDERSDNILALVAADWGMSYSLSGFDFGLQGEAAIADFERDAFARSSGVPKEYWGYFVEGSVGRMPHFLRRTIPYVFDDEGSTFVLALRWDYVDLDGDRGEIIEPGINFRPATDTVFKLSYRFSLNSVGNRDLPGREDWDDEGFVFSLSSYF